MDLDQIFSRINNGIAACEQGIEVDPNPGQKIYLRGMVDGLNASLAVIQDIASEAHKPLYNTDEPDRAVILRIPGVVYEDNDGKLE